MPRIVNTRDEAMTIPLPTGDVVAEPGVPVDVPDAFAFGADPTYDEITGELTWAGRSGLIDESGDWKLADDTVVEPTTTPDPGDTPEEQP